MITFNGRQDILKPAEILERNAKNLYPHISTSRLKTHFNPQEPQPKFYRKYADNIILARKLLRSNLDLYSSIIYSLQELKIGNCTEEAIFAELLGRINGQNNIYSGGIFFDNGTGKKKMLDHAIAFITNQIVDNKKDCFFKNKEAIIIDPWLGITDFAGNYFTKIKSVFRNTFKKLPNNNYEMAIAGVKTKNPKEYKKFLKKYGSYTDFSITLFDDSRLRNPPIQKFRELFPELIFKNFKPIELPD